VDRDQSSDTTITITRGTHPEISPRTETSSRHMDTKEASVATLNLPPVKILTPSAKAASQGTKSPAVPAIQRVPEGLGNTFGSLVHKMLELHVGKIEWSDRKFSRFIAEITERPVSESASHELLALAKSDVAAVLVSKEWSDLTTGATHMWSEVPMASVEGGDLVNAKADLIIKYSDGSIRVVDFKTIPVLPADASAVCDQNGYTQQVQAYCRLAKNVYKAPVVTGCVLFTNPIHMLNL
jgi:ATP-dependent exoDNAse (exonuclease V) beta subunit